MVARQERDTVVVGCDGSWQSNRAVDVAARVAARRGCRLALLVVTRSGSSADGSLRGYAVEEVAVRARAHETAQLAEERALAQAPRLIVERVIGDVDGPSVRDLADRAVLLVLGAHGGEGQRALSLNSPSEELVRHLKVPILIPGEAAPRPSRVPHLPHVVVGVDGRGGEEELIGIAAGEAVARGCSLVIVRAVRMGEAGGGIARPDVWDETWMAVHHADHTTSVSSRVVVSVGDPVAALTAECRPDDLLVVGTRGQGRLSGLVAGSVARGVLDAGECDVMVVPPAVQARPWGVGRSAM